MSLLSSILGDKSLALQPCLVFSEPDSQGYIRAINASNQDLALFQVSDSSIFRVLGTSQQQICTYKQSSLSGTITLQIHGQEIKVKHSWEGMQYGKDVHSPSGMLKWRPGNGGYHELRDSRKTLLARGKLPGSLRKKSHNLEVFVTGNEFFLDLILASWVGTLKENNKSKKDETKAAMEIVNALVGV